MGGKIQEIKLELEKRESNTNKINIDICNKVNTLEKQIEEMKKENLLFKEKINNDSEKINDLETIIKELKSEIEELKEWKEKYDKEIQKTIQKKKDKEFLKKIDSKIIKEKKEIDFLEERFKKNDPILMKKNMVYKLLYRATEDGNSASSFHKKCDNISGTLTVIKTNKGLRFGGYTEQTWNSSQSGVQKKDSNGIAFCYSLDFFKIYNNIDKAPSSIKCYTDGPSFYGGECNILDIYFPIDTKISKTDYTKSQTSYGQFEKNYEINNGESKFVMQELEVFQILLD